MFIRPSAPRPRSARLALLYAVVALLSGCDLLGIEGSAAVASRREAEGKAIGGACRHAARSIEQCYEANKKADKAAVFAGWREMNDYMRENKLDAMPAAGASPEPAEDGGEADASHGSGKASPGSKAGKAGAVKPAVAAKPHA